MITNALWSGSLSAEDGTTGGREGHEDAAFCVSAVHGPEPEEVQIPLKYAFISCPSLQVSELEDRTGAGQLEFFIIVISSNKCNPQKSQATLVERV